MKEKKYFIAYFAVMGLLLSWLTLQLTNFENKMMVSNRFYSDDAIVVSMTGVSDEELSDIIEKIKPKQILWKEYSSTSRSYYFVSGVNFPTITKTSGAKNSLIYLGDDMNANFKGEAERLGFEDQESILNSSAYFPLDSAYDGNDGKWVFDGIKIDETVNEIIKTIGNDKISIMDSASGQSRRALKNVPIKGLYLGSMLVVVITTCLMLMIWLDRKKNFINISRISGASKKQILFKLSKHILFFCLMSMISGILVVVFFDSFVIFGNSFIAPLTNILAINTFVLVVYTIFVSLQLDKMVKL